MTGGQKLILSHLSAFESEPSVNTGQLDGWHWQRVEKWLEQCRHNHQKCAAATALLDPRAGTPARWLPTRLIDSADVNNLKIVKTADLSVEEKQQASYLVLSHCWGKKSFLKLTLDNETRLRDGFQISELPRNFQDAITATRKLGFRFIWIDALCIIQDKGGDWSSESLLMHKVYGNAEICLAAAASRDAEGGLFRSRDLNRFRSIPIDLLLANETDPSQAPTLTKFCAYPHLGSNSIELWKRSVEESPLNRRAWVLQERLLSRRTTYFTQEQICWECKELRSLEMIPNDAWTTSSQSGPQYTFLGWDDIFNFKDWEPESCELDETSGPGSRMYWNWKRIIVAYTECDPLTQETDKLVAVSGVASAFSKYLKTDYFAGLWGRFLLLDLLWYVPDPSRSQRQRSYRAPTWSWASVDGVIHWEDITWKEDRYWVAFAEVSEDHVEVQPVTAVEGTGLGTVGSDTHLSLFGFLLPWSHVVSYSDDNFDTTFHLRFDVQETSSIKKGQMELFPLIKDVTKDGSRDEIWIRGLLLERVQVEGSLNDGIRHRRLGTFKISSSWLDYLSGGIELGSDGWLGFGKTKVTIV